MKIIQLTAENLKKITAVQITPDGNVVQITGKNGQGKTSVLDAIWWCLTGAENIQRKPIHDGADSARIEMQIGKDKVEMIIERTFTEKNSYLTVKTVDGAKYPSPQKFCDDLIGAITLDPLQFMRDDAEDQFDTLRQIVSLDIDPAELDKLNKEDFDKRTLINRDARSKRAAAAAITFDCEMDAQPVDETALLDQMQAGADQNATLERRKFARANVAAAVKTLTGEADSLEEALSGAISEIEGKGNAELRRIEAEIEALQNKLTVTGAQIAIDVKAIRDRTTAKVLELREKAASEQKRLDEAPALPEPVILDDLRTQLDAAKALNAQIASRDRRLALEKEAAQLEDMAGAFTQAIERRDAQKAEAIAKANMPVPGLSFGDGFVTFNGIPLDQASDAEQLTVSMSIAAAMNPKLRVLRIRDGSLLDDDAMARLTAFADERDMQIWIERVDGSGTVGFVMEDGHIKGQDLQPTPAKAKKGAAKGEPAAPVSEPIDIL